MSLVRLSRGPRAWVAWSGGKNAAHALDVVRSEGQLRIEGLYARVDASGGLPESQVSRALLVEQAASVGLPLVTVSQTESEPSRPEGMDALVFGDSAGSITLEDNRAWAVRLGVTPAFPLVDVPAHELAAAMLAAGVRSVLTAVDHTRAPRAWVGRTFSQALMDEYPKGVHPTGGGGEFHTFCCGGRALGRPISPSWVELEHTDRWAIARLAPGARRAYGDDPTFGEG